MADAVIGALRVTLGADSAAFEKQMNTLAGKLQSIGAKISAIGAGLTAGITLPLVAFGKKAFAAFEESEKAIAKLDAALKSTGGAVGFTSKQLQAMAAQLQRISTFDDDEILSNVTANLLRFGQISGSTFKDAQLAVLNIAAAMKTDLASAAAIVGKALNNPATAFGALRRAGISFTEAQKKVIEQLVKTGKTAEAQRKILDGFAAAFGGQAAALAGTASGKWQQAMNSISDALEIVGEKVAPLIISLADHIKALAESFTALDPSTQQLIFNFGVVAASIGPILAPLGLLSIGLGGLYKTLKPLILLLGQFAKTLALLAIANPEIALIVALAGALVYLGTRQTDAEKAAEAHKDAMIRLNQAIEDVKNGIPGAADNLRQIATEELAAAKAALAHAKAQLELDKALASSSRRAAGIGNIPQDTQNVADSLKAISELESTINEGKAALEKTGQSFTDTTAAAKQLGSTDLHGWSESFRANLRFVGEDAVTTAANVRKLVDAASLAPDAVPTANPAQPSALLTSWQKLQADLTPIFEAIKASALAFSQAVGPIFTETQKTALASLNAVGHALLGASMNFTTLKTSAVDAMQGIAKGATQWLEGALGNAIDDVIAKLQQLEAQFKSLYDKVVGHSYIPDLVKGSEKWMGRLATSLPALAQKAADGTALAISNATKALNSEMADSGGQGAAQPVQNFYATVKIETPDLSSFQQSRQQITNDLADMFAGARLRPA